MRTSEFIRKVEELGYRAVDIVDYIRVHRGPCLVATVFKDKDKALDTIWNEYVSDELFDILVEYARTPIKERESVKKYYLYNPIKKSYFNYFIEEKKYNWLNSTEMDGIKTQFTKEEIENHELRDLMELLIKEEVR